MVKLYSRINALQEIDTAGFNKKEAAMVKPLPFMISKITKTKHKIKMLELFKELNLDLSSATELNANTLLHKSLKYNENLEVIFKLMQLKPSLVFKMTFDNINILHSAVLSGEYRNVKLTLNMFRYLVGIKYTPPFTRARQQAGKADIIENTPHNFSVLTEEDAIEKLKNLTLNDFLNTSSKIREILVHKDNLNMIAFTTQVTKAKKNLFENCLHLLATSLNSTNSKSIAEIIKFLTQFVDPQAFHQKNSKQQTPYEALKIKDEKNNKNLGRSDVLKLLKSNSDPFSKFMEFSKKLEEVQMNQIEFKNQVLTFKGDNRRDIQQLIGRIDDLHEFVSMEMNS